MPPGLAPFHTDASKLRQVLLNLVGNALNSHSGAGSLYGSRAIL
jgi:signal transduction histidine kinase